MFSCATIKVLKLCTETFLMFKTIACTNVDALDSRRGTNLNFCNSNINVFPNSIFENTNAEELLISKNSISKLPSEIEKLQNLVNLDVGYNKLASLPAEVGKLTNLETLILSNNKLVSLPNEIGKLTNLKNLDIYRNELVSLPAEVGKLTNLQNLGVGYNKLASLPAEVGKLTNLQNLDLCANKLASLPAEVGKLTNLQNLDVGYNKLASLPAEVGKLTNLETLILSNNKLVSLPNEIGKLTKLKNLDLYGNKLVSLPAEVGKLTNLQNLDLCANKLASLPNEIEELVSLQKLDLQINNLSNLPAGIGNLVKLKLLYISHNKLKSLPSEIEKLKNLKKLYLGNTRLESLPSEIGNLENLEELDLGNTDLIYLPSEIGNLKKLEKLDLGNTDLTYLPNEIGKLSQMFLFSSLNIQKNKLKDIGKESDLGKRELKRLFGNRLLLDLDADWSAKITEFAAIEKMKQAEIHWDVEKLVKYKIFQTARFSPNKRSVDIKIQNELNIHGNFKVRKTMPDGTSQEVECTFDNFIKKHVNRIFQEKENARDCVVREEYLENVTGLLECTIELLNGLIHDTRNHEFTKRSLEMIAEAFLLCPDEQIQNLRSLYFILSTVKDIQEKAANRNDIYHRSHMQRFIEYCIGEIKENTMNVITTPISDAECKYEQYEWKIDLSSLLGFEVRSENNTCFVDNRNAIYDGSKGNALDAFFTKFTVQNVARMLVPQIKNYINLVKIIIDCKETGTEWNAEEIGRFFTPVTEEGVQKYLVEMLKAAIIKE